MIEIIETKEEWTAVLDEITCYDFYHSYEYHSILKKNSEVPILIVYRNENVTIALPFVKRKINRIYNDLTSVHGYLGPISKGLRADFDSSSFNRAFEKLMETENIVSVFSKLNPYIANQGVILNSLGIIENIGELLYFDQHEDEETQLNQYNRNTRQKLKQLQKNYTVRIVDNEKEINSFIKLYHKGLDRLNAKKLFYFENNYFETLLTSKNIDSKMLIAINNETKEIAGGIFCTETKEIAHIELAFTNEKYFKDSPIRLLFDESRKIYKKNKIKYLNLGGGSGGREGSLMRFKATFTKNYKDFNVWKYIALPEKYEELLTAEQLKIESNHFPKYRLTFKN